MHNYHSNGIHYKYSDPPFVKVAVLSITIKNPVFKILPFILSYIKSVCGTGMFLVLSVKMEFEKDLRT